MAPEMAAFEYWLPLVLFLPVLAAVFLALGVAELMRHCLSVVRWQPGGSEVGGRVVRWAA